MRKDRATGADLKSLQLQIAANLWAAIKSDRELSAAKDVARALSARSGVGRGTVQRALNGAANLELSSLLNLAHTLSRTVAQLVTRLGAPKPDPSLHSDTWDYDDVSRALTHEE